MQVLVRRLALLKSAPTRGQFNGGGWLVGLHIFRNDIDRRNYCGFSEFTIACTSWIVCMHISHSSGVVLGFIHMDICAKRTVRFECLKYLHMLNCNYWSMFECLHSQNIMKCDCDHVYIAAVEYERLIIGRVLLELTSQSRVILRYWNKYDVLSSCYYILKQI